jgi:hypothetical protein
LGSRWSKQYFFAHVADSDLIDWLSEPGQAFAKLANWQAFDLAQIVSRMEQDRSAKPRIEISASISKMNNLSVRWWTLENATDLATRREKEAEVAQDMRDRTELADVTKNTVSPPVVVLREAQLPSS